MSANEIRMLADNLKVWREECGVDPAHIWDAHVKMEAALLASAAMVERCEEVRAKIAKHNKVFNEVWGHDDTFDGNKLIDYIMKGVTDGTKH